MVLKAPPERCFLNFLLNFPSARVILVLETGKAREAAYPHLMNLLNALQRQPSLVQVVAAIFVFP